MAVGHIAYNASTQHGVFLRSVITQMENAVESLSDLAATMALMIDGDVNADASYSYMATKFGFPDTATAKAAYFEILSLVGKFPDNPATAVTAVRAAIVQAANKFR
jgi:hypothetical protein